MVLGNIFGPDVIIVVVIAVVLLFGAGQLPKLARSVGEASKEIKQIHHDAEKPGAEVGAEPISDTVTLSRAELDALIAAREANARRQSPTLPPS